jgi:hypothetical protein
MERKIGKKSKTRLELNNNTNKKDNLFVQLNQSSLWEEYGNARHEKIHGQYQY